MYGYRSTSIIKAYLKTHRRLTGALCYEQDTDLKNRRKNGQAYDRRYQPAGKMS